jgi:hypothetical protein
VSHSRRAANMNAETLTLFLNVCEAPDWTQVRMMAELNMTVKHDQTADAAQANFEKAIAAAHAQHGSWIRQVEWSADRKSAILSGPGYRVTLSFDEQNVYARGNVPLALKLLEGPMRRFVEKTLAKGS